MKRYANNGGTAVEWEPVAAFDADFNEVARALRFNVAGTVTLVSPKGVAYTATVAVGEVFQGHVARINSASTSLAPGDVLKLF